MRRAARDGDADRRSCGCIRHRRGRRRSHRCARSGHGRPAPRLLGAFSWRLGVAADDEEHERHRWQVRDRRSSRTCFASERECDHVELLELELLDELGPVVSSSSQPVSPTMPSVAAPESRRRKSRRDAVRGAGSLAGSSADEGSRGLLSAMWTLPVGVERETDLVRENAVPHAALATGSVSFIPGRGHARGGAGAGRSRRSSCSNRWSCWRARSNCCWIVQSCCSRHCCSTSWYARSCSTSCCSREQKMSSIHSTSSRPAGREGLSRRSRNVQPRSRRRNPAPRRRRRRHRRAGGGSRAARAPCPVRRS